MPREETSVHAQDNSQPQHFNVLNIRVVKDYPEIKCLTRDPTPTRASRSRDTVQLRKKPSGGMVSKSKETGLVEDYRDINRLTRDPVTLQASRGRDRVPLQNKPPGRLASKVKDPVRFASMCLP